ncbi:MAG: RagB/SusD family nutrient uptake outer membrane protein [Mucilaginibacter sp.]|nr:RagB/SusD family nutrient uptake outer membrane protein [Mucilaginibacter sp.]
MKLNIHSYETGRFGVKTHLFLFILLLIMLSALTSCKKAVTVDAPVNQLVASTVFNNSNSATAAQLNIYATMSSVNTVKATGLSSDEFVNYIPNVSFNDFYKNALNPVNDGITFPIWGNAYQNIYEANAVIEGVQDSKKINPQVGQQLIGEAKFIRAFWHFYLVNLYGDVPLIINTDYKASASARRTPKSQVYQQIIADLKDAQNLLNTNFVDASDTTVTTDRVRPTKWAARALLARTYLYYGNLTGDASNYTNAETEASALIDNNAPFSLKLVPDLSTVFLKNSTEAIWQLLPVNLGYNTPEGAAFILLDAPTSSGQVSVISDQLLNAFEPGDKRKTTWINAITVAGTTYNFPFKYQVQSGGDITEYSMALRLSEQYLIRAEARAQQMNLTGAVADLNVIRNRAGLPGVITTTQAELFAAIQHERQVELFAEWGHRWLDLKRTGSVNTVMSIVTPLKGGRWQSYQQLYPIPPLDINSDHNLTQNPGY